MQSDRKTLPYDIGSAKSIFEYSKGLLGKTLRDFVWQGYEPKKGKGSLGQMVENIFFMLETNNYAGADFSKAGMELKCTANYYDATRTLQSIPRTQLRYTNYNFPNLLSLQRDYFSNHIQTSALTEESHQGAGYTHARCLGHFSDTLSFDPLLSSYFFSFFAAKFRDLSDVNKTLRSF